MERVLAQLSASGYKITPQRRLVLEVIMKSDRHLTAEEVAEQVREIQPSVSVATIYRNINLLADLGLLSRLDIHAGPSRYEVFQGHDHHMVCLQCGTAIKLGICPMEEEILQAAQAVGFSVGSHHFEITGICKECQERLKEQNK